VQKAIRDQIVEYIDAPYAAAFPGVPIVFPNGPFDWNNPPPRFTQVDVVFHSGTQIAVAGDPRTRFRGHVYVTACVRLGSGNRGALDVLDWFATRLAYARIARIQLQAPDPDGNLERKGWYLENLKFAFFADPA